LSLACHAPWWSRNRAATREWFQVLVCCGVARAPPCDRPSVTHWLPHGWTARRTALAPIATPLLAGVGFLPHALMCFSGQNVTESRSTPANAPCMDVRTVGRGGHMAPTGHAASLHLTTLFSLIAVGAPSPRLSRLFGGSYQMTKPHCHQRHTCAPHGRHIFLRTTHPPHRHRLLADEKRKHHVLQKDHCCRRAGRGGLGRRVHAQPKRLKQQAE
jgi:hypothetical protein